MKSILFLLAVAAATNLGSFTTTDILGSPVDLGRYVGYPTIIVNVASEWGLTKREYTELQQLYAEFQDRGLKIIAFPSNEFANQEPDSNSVIFERVKSEYGVTFDMMAKTKVNGDDAEPVYKWLKNHKNGSGFLFNNIKWVCSLV